MEPQPTSELQQEGRSTPQRWIAHIAVVGFHHAQGNHIELIFPPLDEETQTLYYWEYVPFLAIPDGSHNSHDDFTFFILPRKPNSPNDPSSNVYKLFGVSCFRQIRAQDLPESSRTADITRTHVQKAVCIISYLPLFGPFHERLSVVTHYYFNQKNFSNTEILESLYNSLVASYSPEKPLIIPDILVGVSLQDLVSKFGRKLLVLFKMAFLELGIVVFSSQPVHNACTTVLGLLSLFPSGIDTLFPDFTAKALSGLMNHSYNETFGLPLQLFHKTCLFHPYITLQQIDGLKRGVGFLIGTSNMLYIKSPPPSTCLLVDAVEGTVEFHEEIYSKIGALTSSDRRFIDDIISTVAKSRVNQLSQSDEVNINTSWEGSDSWIKAQFARYVYCLLRTTVQIPTFVESVPPEKNLDLGDLDQYNQAWIRAWMNSSNFNQWKESIFLKTDDLLCISSDLPTHPSGPPSVLLDGISDKLSSQLEPLKQITSTTLENALPLKNALNNITSSTFSSIRSNAMQFSKLISESAETFVSNYQDEIAHIDSQQIADNQQNTATTNNNTPPTSNPNPSHGANDKPPVPPSFLQNITNRRRSNTNTNEGRANSGSWLSRVRRNSTGTQTTRPSFASTIGSEGTEKKSGPVNSTTASAVADTNTAETLTNTTNLPPTNNSENSNSENSNSTQHTQNTQTQSPTVPPRHQEGVAVVAKATAQVVSSTGRWLSAFSSKIVDTVVTLTNEVLDELNDNELKGDPGAQETNK